MRPAIVTAATLEFRLPSRLGGCRPQRDDAGGQPVFFIAFGNEAELAPMPGGAGPMTIRPVGQDIW
jgi:hypothetical protein